MIYFLSSASDHNDNLEQFTRKAKARAKSNYLRLLLSSTMSSNISVWTTASPVASQWEMKERIDGHRWWEEIIRKQIHAFSFSGEERPSHTHYMDKSFNHTIPPKTPDVCSYPGVTGLKMRPATVADRVPSPSPVPKVLLSGSPLVPLNSVSSRWLKTILKFPTENEPLFLLLFCIGIIGLQFAREEACSLKRRRRAKKMGFLCCSNNIRLISSRSFAVKSHTQRDIISQES